MNELTILKINIEYNETPYYKLNNYICINDDRFGRIVCFKLYLNDDKIYVDFRELNKYQQFIILRPVTKIINSLEDFKNKWHEYYNYYY
jgi:hypothetical protein